MLRKGSAGLSVNPEILDLFAPAHFEARSLPTSLAATHRGFAFYAWHAIALAKAGRFPQKLHSLVRYGGLSFYAWHARSLSTRRSPATAGRRPVGEGGSLIPFTPFSGAIPAAYDRYLGPMLFQPYAEDLWKGSGVASKTH